MLRGKSVSGILVLPKRVQVPKWVVLQIRMGPFYKGAPNKAP